jgi:hypothetical protein
MQQEEGRKIRLIGPKLKEKEHRYCQNFLAHFEGNKVVSVKAACRGRKKKDDKV